jgi:hypothetical protein
MKGLAAGPERACGSQLLAIVMMTAKRMAT